MEGINPTDIYLIQVINENTRTICEICSKWTIKIPKWCHWLRTRGFFVNLTLKRFRTLFWCFCNWLEQVNVGWDRVEMIVQIAFIAIKLHCNVNFSLMSQTPKTNLVFHAKCTNIFFYLLFSFFRGYWKRPVTWRVKKHVDLQKVLGLSRNFVFLT